MRMTVRIESGPGAGEERRFEQARIRIGRGSDNDWILDDPEHVLSRRHLELRRDADGWVVEDLSKAGTYVNGETAPLGPGAPRRLRGDDRLQLGGYLLHVRDPDAGALQAAAAVDVFAAPAEPDARAAALFDRTWLERHGPPGPGDHPRGDRHEHRAGPVVTPPGEKPLPPEPRRRAPPTETAAPPAFNPFADLADDGAAASTEPAEPAPQTPTPPAENPFAPSPSANPFGVAPPGPAAPAEPVQPTPSAPPPEPAPTPATAAAAPAAADGGAWVRAFLEGAGLDPDAVKVEDEEAFARLAGRQLRELAFGVVQLLAARSEAKGAMRAERTEIAAEANNPLKYSATRAEAARAVLEPRGPGYLAPEPAVAEALDDIKGHEMALLASIQDAVGALLQSFEPERFEQHLEDTKLLSRIFAGSRDARCWQEYKGQYAKLATEAERRFLGRIGDQFAQAYERHARKAPRGSS
jgi:type VI secretion system protein ImpI